MILPPDLAAGPGDEFTQSSPHLFTSLYCTVRGGTHASLDSDEGKRGMHSLPLISSHSSCPSPKVSRKIFQFK